MLSPDDLQAATEILADEQQPGELRNAAEESLVQHLAEVVQDPGQPPGDREAAYSALTDAGYELDDGGDQAPADALSERLGAIEQYLAETPPSEYTQPPQLDPAQYQATF